MRVDQGGFPSTSTAVGLGVTISSVLSLLNYLMQQVSYEYVMTSKLSQDPVENLFGIARQSSGCNTHPTPQKLLVTISCLSFYGLARSVSNGNAGPGALTALLELSTGHTKPGKDDLIQKLLEDGDLSSAEPAIQQLHDVAPDHAACVSAKSDERLIYYFCGYVTRKLVLKANCNNCHALLLTKKKSVELLKVADYTRLRDKGGLLCASGYLFRYIQKLSSWKKTSSVLRWELP